MAVAKYLQIPPLAITDGSRDPEWVAVPCAARWRYGRKEVLRLPLDSKSASTVRKWIRLQKTQALVVAPLCVVLVLLVLATALYGGSGNSAIGVVRLLLIIAIFGLLWWDAVATERGMISQQPRLIRGHGIVIPNVPVTIAGEWVHRNPGVEARFDEPAADRRPSRVAFVFVAAASVLGGAALAAAAFGWLAAVGLASILMLAAGAALLSGALRRF